MITWVSNQGNKIGIVPVSSRTCIIKALSGFLKKISSVLGLHSKPVKCWYTDWNVRGEREGTASNIMHLSLSTTLSLMVFVSKFYMQFLIFADFSFDVFSVAHRKQMPQNLWLHFKFKPTIALKSVVVEDTGKIPNGLNCRTRVLIDNIAPYIVIFIHLT